jgi:hypothetical protein
MHKSRFLALDVSNLYARCGDMWFAFQLAMARPELIPPDCSLGRPSRLYVPANEKPRYAFSTIVLTAEYVDSAMALCHSIRQACMNSLPSDIDVVVYVTEPEKRGLNVSRLLCCFSHGKELALVTVSKPPVEYRGMMYMDADFIVMRFDTLERVLGSTISFGAGIGIGARGLSTGTAGCWC